MSSRFPLAALGAAAALVLVLSGPAAASPPRERRAHDPEAAFEHMLNRVSEELNLSDAQRAEVEPILRSHFEAMRTVRESYVKGDAEAREELRERHHELAKKTEEQLDALLDDSQMERFRELRSEMRERARHRRHEHGEASAPAGPPPI